MIRVANGKPKLFFVKAHNDMGHFTQSHYATSDYFLMGLMEYMEKKEFDSFNMKPDLSKDEIEKILEKIKNNEEIHWLESFWGHEMNRLIKKAGSQLWQFNAVNSSLSGYVRQVVCLGENQLTRWSFIDAHIKLPVFKFLASVMNRLRLNKVRTELNNWNDFLVKVRKKHELDNR